MFHERLKELRKDNKITQQELATKLNVLSRTIRYYESGEREPNFTKLIKIADIFNVTTDYLLGRDLHRNKN